MRRYADITERYRGNDLWHTRAPVTAEKTRLVKQQWPLLPADYLDFLSEIGYLDLAQGGYTIFGGPTSPMDIYDAQTASELEGVVLLGTDFSGYCLGLDLTTGGLVEIGPSAEVVPLGVSFEEFIRAKIAELLSQ